MAILILSNGRQGVSLISSWGAAAVSRGCEVSAPEGGFGMCRIEGP